MWRFNILFLLFVMSSRCVLAQSIEFTANASAAKIGLQDHVQVSYTIHGAPNLPTISIGETKDFVVVGGPFPNDRTDITIVNNRMTQDVSHTMTYILQPKHTGTLIIPAANAKDANGHSWQSNALQLEVVNGSLAAQQQQRQIDPFAALQQRRMQQYQQQQQRQSQQPQQQAPDTKEPDISKDVFIRVVVDKSKVHVGEQVTASYKLYSRLFMQAGISKLPSLNGFWTQDFEIPKLPKPQYETIDGKQYQVFLIKKSALFPQQTGTLELDPAEVTGTARLVQRVRQRDPFADLFNDPAFSLMMNDPFFNNGFFNTVQYRDVPVHLKSAPVKISVTALPDKGKPEDYGGAVGDFELTSNINKKELTTDDAINLTVKITGSGNLKLIEIPKLNLPNGLDAFDPVASDTITGRTTIISGTKTITYPIAPHTPGDYVIPAIPFSYFNPQTNKYVTLQTEPIKIHVTAGKNYKTGGSKNLPALSDIHNINTQPLKSLTIQSKPFLFSGGYWSMYALPLLTFIGFIVWKRKEEELSKDTVLLKNKRANKIALKRLATAKKLLEENKEKPFYEEVSKATWLYLSDKLNIPISTLSRETAKEALDKKKVPFDLQEATERVITNCETALYSPMNGTQQMTRTFEDAINIISKLEGAFKA